MNTVPNSNSLFERVQQLKDRTSIREFETFADYEIDSFPISVLLCKDKNKASD